MASRVTILHTACFLALLHSCFGDVYFHNPKGSNNRLNEKSAARTNANRVFDSQNNNRGGYNVGDATYKPAGTDESLQYRMKYFQSGTFKQYGDGEAQSYLTLEWTNQHGCGGDEDTDPHKQNCNIVLQYMCQDEDVSGATEKLRDGVNTNTQKFTALKKKDENLTQKKARQAADVDVNMAYHETWEWYDKCRNRERCKGLFTADQQLTTNNGLGYSGAIYTRQNKNGNRRGYECPEERDYYPYWHPTPWKDIAILPINMSLCSYHEKESFNVVPRYECLELYVGTKTIRHWSRWNNENDCKTNGGQWTPFYNYLEKAPAYKNEATCKQQTKNGYTYIWGRPLGEYTEQCLVALDAPECKAAPWTRSNHLGNTKGGRASNYTWTLPFFPSGNTKQCVVRIRYNISTDDYDPFNTNSSQNHNKQAGIVSPIQQNPLVDIGAGNTPLQLAINTAQFGRTFQDRSHVFELRPRPSGLEKQRIYNLNVRGKRGNIVQVYPAVEYDFIPNDLHVTTADLVHVQWTGSNTHNNAAPGGDGQTGDAGEGKSGTDRNNIVQLNKLSENFPVPYENSTLWENAKIAWIYHGKKNVSPMDLALNMASSGRYRCFTAKDCPGQKHAKYIFGVGLKMSSTLDDAPASYEGAMLRFNKGTYYYACSRNNNFTNRSQKGTLVVK